MAGLRPKLLPSLTGKTLIGESGLTSEMSLLTDDGGNFGHGENDKWYAISDKLKEVEHVYL